MPCVLRQLAVTLVHFDRVSIRGELICSDRRRRPVPHGRHGFDQANIFGLKRAMVYAQRGFCESRKVHHAGRGGTGKAERLIRHFVELLAGPIALPSKASATMSSWLSWSAVPWRQELASLDLQTIQMREGRWVLADMEGKGRRVRTVAVPIESSHEAACDLWANASVQGAYHTSSSSRARQISSSSGRALQLNTECS